MNVAGAQKNPMKTPAAEAKQTAMNKNSMNNAMPQGGSFFDKFPILKKWWLWVVVGAVVVIGLIVFLFL